MCTYVCVWVYMCIHRYIHSTYTFMYKYIYTHKHTHTLSLFLSLSHTHAHTHTRVHVLMHHFWEYGEYPETVFNSCWYVAVCDAVLQCVLQWVVRKFRISRYPYSLKTNMLCIHISIVWWKGKNVGTAGNASHEDLALQGLFRLVYVTPEVLLCCSLLNCLCTVMLWIVTCCVMLRCACVCVRVPLRVGAATSCGAAGPNMRGVRCVPFVVSFKDPVSLGVTASRRLVNIWVSFEKVSFEKASASNAAYSSEFTCHVTPYQSIANTLLQQITATDYCKRVLQQTTATYYCNTLLQHTTATHYCNWGQRSPSLPLWKEPVMTSATSRFSAKKPVITTAGFFPHKLAVGSEIHDWVRVV